MFRAGRYLFKRADRAEEFEQIHALNYRTFVREVGQYADDGSGRLVDRFHHKNTYFIALRDGALAGMIGVHGEAPFSVAARLPDPTFLERAGTRPVEVRLLAVEPGARHRPITYGLMGAFYEYALTEGFTDVFISGIVGRETMYESMGFVAIGTPVPAGTTAYVPMHVSLTGLKAAVATRWLRWRRRAEQQDAAN
jgi:GNAT superfamily N-acetyltransferase